MPFCTPVLWPPLHYWSVHRWDSKYPLVCQKNETDDAVWVQYRICVVDDVAGLPILLLAYAATKESIEKDWSVVQGALRGLKDATSYNVCKEVLSRLHLGNPSVKKHFVCLFFSFITAYLRQAILAQLIRGAQSPQGGTIDYMKRLKPDAGSGFDLLDVETAFNFLGGLCNIIVADTTKTRSHGRESVSHLPQFPGGDIFTEYPLCPDVLNAVCSCKEKGLLQ